MQYCHQQKGLAQVPDFRCEVLPSPPAPTLPVPPLTPAFTPKQLIHDHFRPCVAGRVSSTIFRSPGLPGKVPMSRRVKEFIEIGDFASLDQLIETLQAIRETLPDFAEAELRMKGDD